MGALPPHPPLATLGPAPEPLCPPSGRPWPPTEGQNRWSSLTFLEGHPQLGALGWSWPLACGSRLPGLLHLHYKAAVRGRLAVRPCGVAVTALFAIQHGSAGRTGAGENIAIAVHGFVFDVFNYCGVMTGGR